MLYRNVGLVACITLLLSLVSLTRGGTRTFGIGFFEGGPYPAHSEFRNHFREQVEALCPAGVTINYPTDGYKSAEWKRAQSRVMARELAGAQDVDLVVATGPWTVEDLLAAGFDKPILAALRFDPVLEGLVDQNGRSIVNNLSVRIRPRKIESDFAYLTELVRADTIGVLYFPSGSEAPTVIDSMRVLGRRIGFEIVTAEGYDVDSAYAFFKAYRQLNKSIDALYLPPMWGCESDRMRQFHAMVGRDRIPVFCSEGEYQVTRGALAGGSVETPLVEAHYQAVKAVRIIGGVIPADLPNVYADARGLALNSQMMRELRIALSTDRRYDVSLIDAPAPDSVERLSVVDAVGVALAQNPDLQATLASLDAAEAAYSEARSVYLPQLELSGSAGYFDDNAVNNDPRYENNRYHARLSLRQEILSLGAIRDIRSAGLERDRTEADQKRAALALELAVTSAFIGALEAEQLRQVELANRRQAQECFQVAKLRNDLREGEADEVWRTEQQWLAALQAVRDSEYNLAVARVVLNTLLGRPGDFPFVPDSRHFTDASFFEQEAVIIEHTKTPRQRSELVAALLDVAVRNNPTLAASDLQVSVQRSRLGRTNAAFYPSIGFYANLDVTDELAARSGINEATPSWSLGAQIKLPLFLGGKQWHERARMNALLDQETWGKDQASLQTAAALRVAWERVLSRCEQFPIAARAAELANQVYPELLSRYTSGKGTVLELIEATREDRSASRNAIGAQMDYFRATADALATIGISAYASGRSCPDELMRLVQSQ
ncbi:MAG: ABC transporter substrate binding protein [Candidatus Zixiibacteriota bacterium]